MILGKSVKTKQEALKLMATTEEVLESVFEFIKTTRKKLEIIQNLQTHYTQLVHDNEVLASRMEPDQLCRSRTHLACRSTSLQTMSHLVCRYQMILMRDYMKAREYLGIPMSQEAWTAFSDQAEEASNNIQKIEEYLEHIVPSLFLGRRAE